MAKWLLFTNKQVDGVAKGDDQRCYASDSGSSGDERFTGTPPGGQVAKLLNCTTDDVAFLVNAGKLRALGKPGANTVKFFSSIKLITLPADRDWLDEATKTISQFWRRRNARRNGLTIERHADVPSNSNDKE
jgi:hypothetical protein